MKNPTAANKNLSRRSGGMKGSFSRLKKGCGSFYSINRLQL
jgi:hypothetical protein